MGQLLQKLTGSLSGNIGDTVKQIASIWKVDPAVVLEKQTEIQKMANDLAIKTIESANTEIAAAADIIKAEAQSQSWLPRNVRPLLLLLWGTCISVNVVAAIIAHYFISQTITPVPVDPWVYKLTAIGFTGYVTARSWEKIQNAE
jgi:hypothetical protein